jgi:phosphatidylinositol alpha-mannosyltransferase
MYGRATVTVLPSIGEAFGMSLVESLACGTPVVGSQDGGAPDFVRPDAGVLFDPGSLRHEPTNVDGLTEAIHAAVRLYGNPRLAHTCRESIRHLGWDTLGPRLEKLYDITRQPHRSAA